MILKPPIAGTAALAGVLALTACSGSSSAPRAASPVTAIAHGAEIGTAPSTWTTDDYDGVALSTDAPDRTELPQVHGVYVHASDRPSAFGEYAAAFQSEQRRASQFMTNATGMAFRWDERQSEDGRVLHDITVVRSKANHHRLSGSGQFSLVGDALQQAGLTDPDKKYYVWLDADSAYCGQAQGRYDARRAGDNTANGSSYAVSYRIGSPYEQIGGWCNPVLHELAHGMGAVAEHMPHYYGGGHCNDDANDVMCVISASPGGAIDRERSRTLDTGNNDYLDPAADLADTTGATLPWWTVNLSRFLCPRSAADRTAPDCALPNQPFGDEPVSEPSPSPTSGGGGKGGGKPTKG